MIRRAAAFMLVAMLTVSPWFVEDGRGWDYPLTVIVTHQDQRFYVGDEVVVRAYIFRYGERFDPDLVELAVGTDYRDHPIERLADGLYEGRVTVTEDQLDWTHFFPIEVRVRTERPEFEFNWEHREVYVHDVPHFHVNVHIEDETDLTPLPGEPVEFLVTTTYGDHFVDPDEGSLGMWANTSDRTSSMELEVERVGVGNFRGTFTVPVNVTSDKTYHLNTWASFGDAVGKKEARGSGSVYVRPFDIWVRNVGWNNKSCLMEFHVSQRDGSPLEGAILVMNVTYYNRTGELAGYPVNLTVGSDGSAVLEMEHPDINHSSWGPVASGSINHEGFTQSFYGWIENPEHYEPSPSYWEGLRAINLDYVQLPPGEEVDLRFSLLHNGTPLADTMVDTYVFGPNTVLFFGTVETNAEGVLEVSVKVPSTRLFEGMSGPLTAQFKAETPEGYDVAAASLEQSYWNTSRGEMAWTSYNTSMELMDRGDGSFDLEIRSADLDGTAETVYVSWQPAPYEYRGAWYLPEWYRGMDDSVDFIKVTWDGEAYRGRLDPPDFIPRDVPLYVRAYLVLYDLPHSDPRYVYAVNASAYAATNAPTVNITSPRDGATIDDDLVHIRVEATDDVGVQRIGLRLDGGDWTFMDGGDVYEVTLETGTLEEGLHVLEARAYDGIKFSQMDRVEFEYREEEVVTFDTTPFWVLLLVLLFVIGLVVMMLTRSKGPGQP